MGQVSPKTAILDVAACGPLKAWSVIVTILGDLCLARSDRLAGRALNEIALGLGISAQTVRVALHRLRRDAWIDSVKIGRDASYFLSEKGWKETQSVKAVIYATEAPGARPLSVAIAPPHLNVTEFAASLPASAVILGPRMALLPDDTDLGPEILCWRAEPGSLPDWAEEAIAPGSLRADYAKLAAVVSNILSRPLPTEAMDLLALRISTLHHWRRLRLRHGDLPDLVLGSEWEGAQARQVVMQLLSAVPRSTLDAAVSE